DFGLKGRAALVAASSRGLGRAVAEELANEGADLLLCARGKEDLKKTRYEIASRTPARVTAVAANLTEPEEVTRVVDRGLQEFGKVDILVTNTGGPPSGVFESLTQEAWQDALRQNLESVLNLTRAVLPGMKERQWGRILNITSISVKQPVDNLMLSNSVRAAVTGFARTLANEVAPFGITVNNVLPGYTRTSRVEELADQIAKAKGLTVEKAIGGWESQIPMGRIGDPREFSALVAFLASERASYITGTSIPVDGGWIRSLY
ncbi:SDR family oxidoreductase, partial [bacterium]|nr:SDR family oxidoreductase [bacterium]